MSGLTASQQSVTFVQSSASIVCCLTEALCSTQLPTRTYQTCQTLLLHLPIFHCTCQNLP